MKKRRKILLTSAVVVLAVIVLMSIFSFVILEPNIKIVGMQTLDDAKLVRTESGICFTDRYGREIESKFFESREYLPIAKIPKHTLDAFVSVEDKRFYSHCGVDYWRIIGATINNIRALSFKEGGSTITQQLAKNTHLSGDKNIGRKINEIRIAKEIERKYSKNKILEMYLNMLYFGDNLYGLNAAAKSIFDKEVGNLSVSESAMLAGIINNPYKNNPYKFFENADSRRKSVLKRMLKNGKISTTEYKSALIDTPKIRDDLVKESPYLLGAMKEVNEISGKLLQNKNGKTKVLTYLDPELQAKTKQILLTSELPEQADARILIMENNCGKIICDETLSGNNLSALKRQPGSAIKPMLCYAPLLENGTIYSCTPIEDAQTDFDGYSPSNYHDRYYGWVSAKEALSSSLNIPAVKLLSIGGVEYCKSECKKLGINFSDKDSSLALALGGMTDGIGLNSLTSAYSAFASNGNYIKESMIAEIYDASGRKIYSDNRKKNRVFSEATAFLVNDMLSDCAKTGTAKKLARFNNVCAKTGTVGNKDGNSDLYCIAYSPKYTVAVWIGSMKEKMPNSFTSGNTACEIVAIVFDILGDKSEFLRPSSVTCRYVDMRKITLEHKVMLAGPDVEIKDKKCEWFSEKFLPTEYSTPQYGYYFDYDDFLNLDFFRYIYG